jgi:hypothetical protein
LILTAVLLKPCPECGQEAPAGVPRRLLGREPLLPRRSPLLPCRRMLAVLSGVLLPPPPLLPPSLPQPLAAGWLKAEAPEVPGMGAAACERHTRISSCHEQHCLHRPRWQHY